MQNKKLFEIILENQTVSKGGLVGTWDGYQLIK